MSNHVIQGLWFGESLTNLERLCMKSFMDNGHEFHLYVYDELQDIPQGVIVKDANEIVPRTRIKEFRWFAGFSDFFRYMLLAKKGGWYVDMDVICLRPLDFSSEYVFAAHGCKDHTLGYAPLIPSDMYGYKSDQLVGDGIIKAPVNSLLMDYCCKVIEANSKKGSNDIAYDELGPRLFKRAVTTFGLEKYIQAPIIFDAVPPDQVPRVLDPNVPWDLSNSYTAHLSGSRWEHGSRRGTIDSVGMLPNARYADGCLYEQLKKRYGVPVDKISIVLATRNRPHNLRRLYQSIKDTATIMPEVIVAVDDDDTVSIPVAQELGFKYIVGPRIPLSKIYNKLAAVFQGDIIMYGADDMVFRKKGWDDLVRADFAKYPDHILLVHAFDGLQTERCATFGFLHRKWLETLGFLFPPHLAIIYQDNWLADVSRALNRSVYYDFMIVEHLHHNVGKAPMDQTYLDALPKAEADKVLWETTQHLLAADVEKLRVVIAKGPEITQYKRPVPHQPPTSRPNPPQTGLRKYDRNGLVVDWWSRHPRGK